MTTPPAIPISDDVPCDRCGYNLCTLLPDANCPECGFETLHSIRVHHEQALSAQILRRLAWGAYCCATAVGVLTIMLIGFLTYFHFFNWEVPVILMAVMATAGAWLCTSPSARWRNAWRGRIVHMAGRWLIFTWSVVWSLAVLEVLHFSLALEHSILLLPVGGAFTIVHVLAVTRGQRWHRLRTALKVVAMLLVTLAILCLLTLQLEYGFRVGNRPWWNTLLRSTLAWAGLAIPVTLWFAIQCALKARAMRRSPEANLNGN